MLQVSNGPVGMSPEQFVYWLQGFVEIRDKEQVGLSEREWDIIKDHLQEVFVKKTPDRTDPNKVTVPQPVDPNNPPRFIC